MSKWFDSEYLASVRMEVVGRNKKGLRGVEGLFWKNRVHSSEC